MRKGSKSGKDPEVNFWMNVKSSKDGCWEWVGYKDRSGYGLTSYSNKKWASHRLSWMIHFGDPGELFVLHKCDNPACVRPDHLFIGTQADNVRDMMQKGRSGTTKTSADDVRRIRAEYESAPVSGSRKARGVLDALVKKYGLDKRNIQDIAKGRTRKTVL